MNVDEVNARMNCEKWGVSQANWMRYARTIQYTIETVLEDEFFVVDYVDDWNYREFKSALENLKRFTLEAAERLNGYDQKGEIKHES